MILSGDNPRETMQRISGPTFYLKYLFPIGWFGFLSLFIVLVLLSGATEDSLIMLAIPALIILISLNIFKKQFWSLADDVFDEGDSLLFRRGSKEQRVYLKDIISMDHRKRYSSERIIIKSQSDGKIGKELCFALPTRYKTSLSNPIVDDLTARINRAKSD